MLGPQLSKEKQNEASLSGSNFINLYVKKQFLVRKKSRTVKKIENVIAYYLRTGKYVKKNLRDLDPAGQKNIHQKT
jgi:hypothetical protein